MGLPRGDAVELRVCENNLPADDLRLHLLAVEWTRISDEQAFPGRAGSGLPRLAQLIDDLRARIVAPEIRALPRRWGSVNQLLACRDLENAWPAWRTRAAALFAPDQG